MPTGLTDTAVYMQNRELSWLKFNERVLKEANREEEPLLERLKFISIFTSNLDEFFMVRVGALSDCALLDESPIDNKTAMTAQEQLSEIFRAVSPLYALRGQAFSSVLEGLARHGVHLVRMEDIGDVERKVLKKHFIHDVLPLLSPQIIDSRHPFPHLSNKQLHIAVMLEKKRGPLFGIIAMPSKISRLVKLEGSEGCRFVLLEDLIWHFANIAFGTYKVIEKNIIAVTRNADIDTEEDLLDEDIDHRSHMKKLLKKRQRLSPVRLEIAYLASHEMLEFFCYKLGLSLPQIFHSCAPLDLSFAFSLDHVIDKETMKALVWPSHVPADTLPSEKRKNILKLIPHKDMLFSYPFESISPFLSLIRQAAEDPSVISIKITLYRIDTQSKLADYLIHAAENGKEIVVLMELRARFDENNNIEWAHRFEESGCRVVYGLVGYKVHSKVCLITRREYGKIHFITQIGTGNFNEKTAKQYTDLALVTSNPEIGHDATNLFTNLLIGNLEGEYNRLWVAPNNFKNNILQCIEKEKQKALSGEKGRIIIQCNSLTDRKIIEKLSEASNAGVKISMIVRGICCLLPGVPGATENIGVLSIVGKFLEHSRIFCFGSDAEKMIYISSGDLMTRNTQRRVEVACPILDTDLKDRIFDMLETMLMDNTHAWELFADGRYVLRRHPDADLIINSQEIFVQEASAVALRAQSHKDKVRTNTLAEHIRNLVKQLSKWYYDSINLQSKKVYK